VHRIVCTYAY